MAYINILRTNMIAKMYKKVAPLSKTEVLKLSPLKDYKHAKDVSTTLLTFNELAQACKFYPIYFSVENDGVLPIAILGFNDNNLFLDGKNNWEKNYYIPAVFRAYPLGMAKKEGSDDQYTVVYDSEHDGINKKDGKPVADDKGELTEFGQKAVDFLQNLQGDINRTREAFKILTEYNLLKFANVDITKGEAKYQIKGVGMIDQEALEALEDDKVLDLVKKGIYRLIVMHLLSVNNVRNLTERV